MKNENSGYLLIDFTSPPHATTDALVPFGIDGPALLVSVALVDILQISFVSDVCCVEVEEAPEGVGEALGGSCCIHRSSGRRRRCCFSGRHHRLCRRRRRRRSAPGLPV